MRNTCPWLKFQGDMSSWLLPASCLNSHIDNLSCRSGLMCMPLDQIASLWQTQAADRRQSSIPSMVHAQHVILAGVSIGLQKRTTRLCWALLRCCTSPKPIMSPICRAFRLSGIPIECTAIQKQGMPYCDLALVHLDTCNFLLIWVGICIFLNL